MKFLVYYIKYYIIISELAVLQKNKTTFGEIENNFLNTNEYSPTVIFNTDKNLPIPNVNKEIDGLTFFSGSVNEAIKYF